jgi:hypothetical protein
VVCGFSALSPMLEYHMQKYSAAAQESYQLHLSALHPVHIDLVSGAINDVHDCMHPRDQYVLHIGATVTQTI